MTENRRIRNRMSAILLVALVAACARDAGTPIGSDAAAPAAARPIWGASPGAGSYFNDGGDGDVRARFENLFGLVGDREQPIDEVVVIERADGTKSRYGPDQIVALRAKVDGAAHGQPLPLEQTDIVGRIELNVASVTVTQTYSNPFAEKIEAVYVFPLPQNAAVSDFVMAIGDRRIRGIVRDREEAQRIYDQAKAQGYRASLMTQERPNIFTQSVANIEPGQRIDIETTYFEALPWRDGAFEMVVPTVVGPRFNPPGPRADDGRPLGSGVGAVAVGAEGTSGHAVEVAYRRPGEGGDGPGLAIAIELDGGLPLGEIGCRTHAMAIARDGERRATLTLRDGIDVPNRDFVLRYRPRTTELGGAVAVHRDPATGDGWFAMLLQPPGQAVDIEPQPREMVFVVDCSGSMNGEPMAACQRAIRRCLERLCPDDTFTITRFSDVASSLGESPLPATSANVRRGLAYVDGLRANGGTMMERGVLAALTPRVSAGRRRIVTFMTDGYIGNERDILRAVHDHVGDARIFGFGVGTSVNRYLLERMASIGRGVAAYIDPGDSGREQIDTLFARLEKPAFADMRLDWGSADVTSIEPKRLPDLFEGRPVLVHGTVRGELPRSVRVHGMVGRQRQSIELALTEVREHPAIRKLWARARIRSLHDASTWVATPAELTHEIRRLALENGLASAFTSFVAVDATEITAGRHGTTVTVPAQMPRGVRYETTVSGAGGGH